MRSWAGWRVVIDAEPNAAHRALADLESRGCLTHIVTQNVDMLHQKAGSRHVTNLHGRIDQVKCMGCGTVSTRKSMQARLEEQNPQFLDHFLRPQMEQQKQSSGALLGIVRPDGDVELGDNDDAEAALAAFVLPRCPQCGSDCLKPHVTFFGDNVAKPLVEEVTEVVGGCDGLLIVGTSLEVFSAFRFVKRANERGVPLFIVNKGETRAERTGLDTVRFKSEADCTDLLARTAALLLR